MANLILKSTMLIALLLLLHAAGFSQLVPKDTSIPVTIVKPNRTLLEVKNTLEKIGRLRFIYNSDVNQHQVIGIPIGIHTYGAILNMIKEQLNLSYSIEKGFVTLNKQKQPATRIQWFRGKVVDESKMPLSGVLIREKNSKSPPVHSDNDGQFIYTFSRDQQVLELSLEGYEDQLAIKIYDRPLFVQMQLAVTELETAIVNVYAPVTRRNNTASVGILDVSKQSTTIKGTETITALLQSRVPGVLVTPVNGSPGGVSDIQIRGHQSIGLDPGLPPANHPLILVNGVPWINSNKTVNALASMAGTPGSGGIRGGIDALSGINSLDIDRIEVFKDADATAIFGSRGAHGVISISTRSGRPESKTRYSVTASRGIAVSTYIPSRMNTREFFSFQQDMFRLAGLPADSANAPSLHSWPLNRSINWGKYMLGNTSRLQQAHIAASGSAGKQLSYYCGVGFLEETNVLPLKRSNQKASFSLNAGLFPNSWSKTDFSLQCNYSHYQLPAGNPMDLTLLPPNAPYPLDSLDHPVFSENGLSSVNPYTQQFNRYDNKLFTVHATLNSEYSIARCFSFKIRFGFNNIQVDEQSEYPIAAYDKNTKMTASMETANSGYMGVIAESQLQFLDTSSDNRTFSAFLGATYQAQTEKKESLFRSGFKSDYLMRFPETAPKFTHDQLQGQYKYGGLYSGVKVTLQERYLLNFSARLDGSSRLGPEHQSALFGALGAGWIFTKISWMQKRLAFLSFGKLRASYGTTGSDNIGEYSENNLVESDRIPYDGVRTIRPSRLANPGLQWEQNKKMELAIELKSGRWLSMIIAWYRNQTSHQFILHNLPSQTGGTVVGKNHSAVVRNSGIECWISTLYKWKGGSRKYWRTELTLTIPRNRLQSFGNLASSLYSQSLVVGEPLTVRKGFLFKEVNPLTGLNEFYNIAGSSAIDPREDMVVTGHLDPVLYGGFNNELSWGQWKLSIFIEGRKQQAINPELYDLSRLLTVGTDGLPSNYPSYLNNRWRQPGDIAAHQKFSVQPDNEMTTSLLNRMRSDKMLSDGSYIRIRNISLNWSVSQDWVERSRLNDLHLFFRIQNLLILSGFEGGDPTILNPVDIPSLRSFEAGFQLSF